MSRNDVDFRLLKTLSRLPGHPRDDTRVRYRVAAIVPKKFELAEIVYEYRSGEIVIEKAVLRGLVQSVHDEEKVWLSAVHIEKACWHNYFVHGIREIYDFRLERVFTAGEWFNMIDDYLHSSEN